MPNTQPPAAKRSRLPRLLLLGGGLILLALVALVGFAPTIASAVAPGIIEGQAKNHINGSVSVNAARFSWGGPQTIGPVTVRDAAGKDIATLNIGLSSGLITLARVKGDLGTVTLSGNADFQRQADGVSTLDTLLKKQPEKPTGAATPPSAPAPGPAVPRDLKVRVVVDSFSLTLDDAQLAQQTGGAVRTVALRDVKADASLNTSGPSELTLTTRAETTGASGPPRGGSLSIKGSLTDWTDAAGKITTNAAKLDATVDAGELPVAVVDALAGLGGRLTGLIGPTLGGQIVVKGGLAGGDATIALAGANTRVQGAVALKDNLVSAAAPIVISASAAGLAAFGPDLERALKADPAAPAPLSIAQFPDLTMTLSNLKLRLPKDGQKPDLRGSSLDAQITTTAARGSVMLGEGQPAQSLDIAPLNLTLAAPDLGGPVRLTGGGSAAIGGQPAGTMAIDLTASGLLDAAGAPVASLPGGLKGTVALTGVRTALAQPFAAASGLVLEEDIGPTLDLNLTADAQASPNAPAGELPPTALDFTLRAARLTGDGALQFGPDGLRTTGQGVAIAFTGVGRVAARLLPPDGPRIAPAGQDTLRARISGTLPMTGGKTPNFAAAEAKIEARLTGVSAALTDAAVPGSVSRPIVLDDLNITANLRQNASPQAEITLAAGYDNRPFTAQGAFDLPGMFAADGKTLTPAKVRPVGRLEIKDAPIALAGISPTPPKPGAPDMAALLREVVGESVTLALATQPSGKVEGALDVSIDARGDRLSARAGGALSDTALALSGVEIASTLAPGTADTLLRTFAPDLTKGGQAPRLAGPARLVATLDALNIPMENFAPKLDRVGEASLRVSLAGQTIVEGLTLAGGADASGRAASATPLGPVGVEDLLLTARAPIGALMGGASAPIKADFSTGILATAAGGRGVEKAADLTGTLAGSVAGGKPGAIDASVKLTQVVTAALDRALAPVLGRDGMLLGALGDTATIDAAAKIDGSGSVSTIAATLSAGSPRVSMSAPLRLNVLADRIVLAQPSTITWQPDAAFISSMLAGAQGSPPTPAGSVVRDALRRTAGEQPGGQPRTRSGGGMTVESLGAVTLALETLQLARPRAAEGGAPAVGPLKPDLFKLALAANVPSAVVRLDDGKTFRVGKVSADAKSGAGNQIDFALTIADAQLIDANGAAQPPVPSSGITGVIRDLATPTGEVNTAGAEVSAVAKIPTVPTAVVDALANQKGLLVDALGPTITLDAKADRLSMDPSKGGGTLRASAVSPFAEATLSGAIRQGVFVTDAPVSVRVTRIAPALSERLVKGLPITTSLEKTADLLPAILKTDALRVPLNNDMRQLAGAITIDPGELKFKTGGAFSRFLNAIGQKQEGYFGRRLEPLNITIDSGIARYQRWSLPLGEFSVQTEGTVDLVSNRMEVYTFVPFAALSEEAAGLFSRSVGNIPLLGDVITAATLMPFKTSGPLDNPKTEPDLEKFVSEFGKKLRPDDLIKRGIEDLFKPRGGGGGGGGGGVK